ncbi:hypothetical protein ACP4OV_031753 [Aristida adscensionis]
MSSTRVWHRLQNASLHPPPLVSSDDGGDLAGAAEIPILWVLLDYRAYVADRLKRHHRLLHDVGRQDDPGHLLPRPPAAGLQDDEDVTVCLTTKKNREDPKAWVISVDMENNMLQQVAEFAAERTVRLSFAYLHSRIINYLTGAPGTKANLKRPGMVLLGPTIKKHIGMPMPPWVDPKQHDVASQKETKKRDTEVETGDDNHDMVWE